MRISLSTIAVLATMACGGLAVYADTAGTPFTARAAQASPARPAAPVSALAAKRAPTVQVVRRSHYVDQATWQKISTRLDRYLDDRPGRVAVAVYDLATGTRFRYRTHPTFFTASVVKVDILMAVLLHAQAHGRKLTRDERALADRMIRVSDNRAASALWRRIGGSAGLTRANRAFGLRHTVPGPSGYWGITRTCPTDQIRLLNALVGPGGPLSARSKRYALRLMATVTPSQTWGVSAGAQRGDAIAIKNGWLPARLHNGHWVVNSVGRVRGHGHDFLIAVMSEHGSSLGGGVTSVERVSRIVLRTLS